MKSNEISSNEMSSNEMSSNEMDILNPFVRKSIKDGVIITDMLAKVLRKSQYTKNNKSPNNESLVIYRTNYLLDLAKRSSTNPYFVNITDKLRKLYLMYQHYKYCPEWMTPQIKIIEEQINKLTPKTDSKKNTYMSKNTFQSYLNKLLVDTKQSNECNSTNNQNISKSNCKKSKKQKNKANLLYENKHKKKLKANKILKTTQHINHVNGAKYCKNILIKSPKKLIHPLPSQSNLAEFVSDLKDIKEKVNILHNSMNINNIKTKKMLFTPTNNNNNINSSNNNELNDSQLELLMNKIDRLNKIQDETQQALEQLNDDFYNVSNTSNTNSNGITNISDSNNNSIDNNIPTLSLVESPRLKQNSNLLQENIELRNLVSDQQRKIQLLEKKIKLLENEKGIFDT